MRKVIVIKNYFGTNSSSMKKSCSKRIDLPTELIYKEGKMRMPSTILTVMSISTIVIHFTSMQVFIITNTIVVITKEVQAEHQLIHKLELARQAYDQEIFNNLGLLTKKIAAFCLRRVFFYGL
jgi:hypothetical protein